MKDVERGWVSIKKLNVYYQIFNGTVFDKPYKT